jgi:hypothetical protein
MQDAEILSTMTGRKQKAMPVMQLAGMMQFVSICLSDAPKMLGAPVFPLCFRRLAAAFPLP